MKAFETVILTEGDGAKSIRHIARETPTGLLVIQDTWPGNGKPRPRYFYNTNGFERIARSRYTYRRARPKIEIVINPEKGGAS